MRHAWVGGRLALGRRSALLAGLACAVALAGACGGDRGADRAAVMRRAVELSASVTSLVKTDVRVGTGAEAVPGRTVRVHYTGTFMDGTKFESSRDRGEPIEFTLGTGAVIPGWDEGIRGMRVGGERQLTIPASMAYGAAGHGSTIPPNAALKFDVELVGVE
jgi:FKBP-type peptidyl-prolyl cis-trans isomerase FkpA